MRAIFIPLDIGEKKGCHAVTLSSLPDGGKRRTIDILSSICWNVGHQKNFRAWRCARRLRRKSWHRKGFGTSACRFTAHVYFADF